MKKPFILFDFDGVIVDTFSSAYEVKKMICPKITEDEYRKGFEGNIFEWKEPNGHHNSECRHDIDFSTEYMKKMMGNIAVFPGMKEQISTLGQKFTLVIISSTHSSSIRHLLTLHGLENYFTQIMGNDVHPNKSEKIKIVFATYDILASEAVFVTDTLGDIREAAHVGVKSIATTWGFHRPETLMSGSPFRLVREPNDLASTIEEYFVSTK